MSSQTEILDEIQDRADLAWDEHMYDMTCPEEVLDDIRRLVAALRAVITYCEPIASKDRTIEPYPAGERSMARAVLRLVTEALMVEM